MNSVALVSPVDFFRTQVLNASKSLNLPLDDRLEFYVVNLLCEFINPSQLAIDPEMDVLDTPLAFMLKKALESTPDTQIKVYKRLGDTSLYFAGYFQDYFNKKPFDIGYFISMGASAYEQMSQLMRTHRNDMHFAHIYQQLSQEFRKLVAIITEVAGSFISHGDILQTYMRWQETQSSKLRKILEDEGIQPVLFNAKAVQ